MAVPDYQSIMLPLLEYASDGEDHTVREAIAALADDPFELSDEELAELLPSGLQAVFHNRVSWSNTYLKKAGLLEAPRRGYFRITERGFGVLEQSPPRINRQFLNQFDEFVEFQSRNKVSDDKNQEDEASTPQESIDASYNRIRQEVEAELLESIMDCTPAFFERLVVDLLVKMGYGGSRLDAGQTIGKSGDGGIDGIINEDKLGLDVVYIQAKRWEGTVGRPEIQKFAGALQGRRTKKGVFITTSGFSREAEEYVSMIDSRVVLIDGQKLAEFMFDHDLGVSTIISYDLTRIDSDYFEE